MNIINCLTPQDSFGKIKTKSTSSVILSGDGSSCLPLSALVRISPDAGNLITLKANGLYVECCDTGESEIFVSDTTSISMGGTGTALDPIFSNAIISGLAGNTLSILADGLYASQSNTDGLLDGGDVTWTGTGLIFDVTAASYSIEGVLYSSPQTQITLSAAHPTEDRIDVFYVDNTGAVGFLTGVAEPNPVKPQVDPATQLELTSVYIPAGSSVPLLNVLQIYNENIEWVGSQVGFDSVDFGDTADPQLGTVDINAINSTNGDYLLFTNGSTVDLSFYQTLSLFAKLKAVIPASSSFHASFFNGATQVSAEVNIPFNPNNITSYQGVSIPLNLFSYTNNNVDRLRIRYITSGGAYAGFFMDNIYLQSGLTPSITPYIYTSSNGITKFGNDFQLGGTLFKNTTIFTSSFGLTLSGTTPASVANFNVLNTTGIAVNGQTTSGTGVRGTSNGANGFGVLGFNTLGHAGAFLVNSTSGSTAPTVMSIQRVTTGTPSAGMGASLSFLLSGTASPAVANLPSNRIVSTWTNATTLSQTSQLVLTGVNNGTEADLVTLAGNGQLRFNNYGVNTFTGTPTKYLGVTVNGTVIELDPGAAGEIISADNGLTENVPGNVQLGGSLITNTAIDLSSFALSINDLVTGGFIQFLPDSLSSVGTVFSVVSISGTEDYSLTVDNTQIALGSNKPSTNEQNSIIVAAQRSSLSYTDNLTNTFRVGVGLNTGGLGIELFGLPNASTQNRLVGVTSSSSLAGYVTIGSGLSLVSGVLSSTGSVSADNGLTENVANNIQLGGTLLQHTTIDTTASYGLTISGTPVPATANAVLNVINSVATGRAIFASATIGIGLLTQATGGNAINASTTTGDTVQVSSTSGIGVSSISTNSFALSAVSINNIAGQFAVAPASTNTTVDVLNITRQTSGSPAAGMAGTINYQLQSSSGVATSNRLVSKWTDPTLATITSQFIIEGVNSGVSADLLTISGSGSTRLNKYGVSTFTGTAATYAAFDSSGNVIEVSGIGSGPVITADNGLTKNTATNVQFGGTLIQNTVINTGGFNTIWTGSTSGNYILTVSNTSSSATSHGISSTVTGSGNIAVDAVSASYIAVLGTSTSNAGVQGSSTSSSGVVGTSSSGLAFSGQVNHASSTGVVNILQLTRLNSGGAGANGIGAAISYTLETATSGTASVAGSLSFSFTDATLATKTSQFKVATVNNGSNIDALFVNGVGSIQLPEYGAGTFTGTATYALNVDANGNIIEGPVGGGSESTTANNGLTLTGVNIQLGGTLVQNTTIATTSAYTLTVSGSSSRLLDVVSSSAVGAEHALRAAATSAADALKAENTGTGRGIYTTSTSGEAILALATSGTGANISSTTGLGSHITVNPVSTNTSVEISRFQRSTSATAANNIGGYLSTYLETDGGTNFEASRINSIWTDAITASRTSSLEFWTVNSTTSARKMSILGTGAMIWDTYGAGTYTGTATYNLAVDASGNVIEVATGGGGGGDVTKVGTPVNNQIGVWTGDGTIEGGTNLTWNGSTLTVTGATETANNPVLSATQIWNNGSVNFNAIDLDVTNTNSGASSNFLNLKIGGASRFTVRKDGYFTFGATPAAIANVAGGIGFYYNSLALTAAVDASGFKVASNTYYQFSNSANITTGTVDTKIGRDGAAGIIAQSNGTNSQEFRIYNTDNGANDEFLSVGSQNVLNVHQIASEATGTGTVRDIEIVSGTANTRIVKLAGTGSRVVLSDASGNVSGLANSTDGFVLTLSAGAPVWAAASGGGANTALSNLASVAINTSLVSDTDNTDDLGSASIGWKDTYTRTVKFDGSTSGTATVQATAVAGTPTLTLPAVTGTIVQDSEAATASSATPAPQGDARVNYFDVTALATGATFSAPSGTALNHNRLIIRIKDDGTARSLAWNAIYRANSDAALPTTTIVNETIYLEFIYNSADSVWDSIGIVNGLI